ncbi:MAG: terminase family protein [Alphaproteobacteria bacterium]
MTTARPEQITPAGAWRVWMILAGRGWGKTRAGAEDLAAYALWHDRSRLGIVAPTFADARDICVEGTSGLLQVLPEGCVKAWHRSHGALELTNGSRVKLYSADRPARLRGPQHHRVWCDELAAWSRPETFDQILFGLRLGDDPRLIITTTPRPTPLLRDLVARAGRDVWLTRGVTRDNAAHLPPEMLAELEARYAGTRLGRQELQAEMLGYEAGALWNGDVLAALMVAAMPEMRRAVVAIDPALGHGRGNDETGIIAAGIGMDGLFYVLRDRSGRLAGDVWAARAARLAQEVRAEAILVELNAGGELLTRIVQNYAPEIPCKPVRAVRSKWDRAVPIAALYEQRRVRHVGAMTELVEQMRHFTPEQIAVRSPDRVDALVWALGALLGMPELRPGIRGI